MKKQSLNMRRVKSFILLVLLVPFTVIGTVLSISEKVSADDSTIAASAEVVNITYISKKDTEVAAANLTMEVEEKIVVMQKEIAETELLEEVPEYVIEVTEEDIDYLLKVTFAEVGQTGNDLDALAVAATVVNRVQDGNYGGDTIVDVLTAENQFATYSDGNFWICDYYSPTEYDYREVRDSDITEEVRDAVERALLGEDPTDGALFFYAPRWCSEKQEEFFLTLDVVLETDTTKYLA
jgi:N-acetylmuramoyl-L-alanine amidase